MSAVQLSAGSARATAADDRRRCEFAAIQTKEGIGIGSKLAALKRAYGKGELIGSAKNPFFYYSVSGKGKHAMTFTLIGPAKKISGVGAHRRPTGLTASTPGHRPSGSGSG